MPSLLRPILTILIAGTLGFLCYELWYLVQGWIKGTLLGEFPFLVGFGAIIVLLGLADLALDLGHRLWAR